MLKSRISTEHTKDQGLTLQKIKVLFVLTPAWITRHISIQIP